MNATVHPAAVGSSPRRLVRTTAWALSDEPSSHPARPSAVTHPRVMVEIHGGTGGYTLDGFGGVHSRGAAPEVRASAYWPGWNGWDIAKGVAT